MPQIRDAELATDGVALAAIQGLLERVLALEAEVLSLRLDSARAKL